MSQEDGWYEGDPWGDYTIIGCSRNACTVQAIAFSFMGPWELLPPHAHLLEPQEKCEAITLAAGGATARHSVEHGPQGKSKSKRKIWPVPVDQSATMRKKRLYDHGLCPIHGEFMHQVDGWFHDGMKRKYTIIACGKNECPARAKMFSTKGPWELLPECTHLIDGDASA
ncbi:MAG: hypothetical protein U1F54_17925 [Burkholderiales bacterium]